MEEHLQTVWEVFSLKFTTPTIEISDFTIHQICIYVNFLHVYSMYLCSVDTVERDPGPSCLFCETSTLQIDSNVFEALSATIFHW